ncbi:proto-oncogene c-Rel-like [Watersipora subatra]|uniref:proto-oncogene c-Rel-like n=1 Tax=Watersipora subatra TaxID=2589382 RepID=UPI00355C1D7C
MPPPLSKQHGYLEIITQPTSSLRFRYKSEAGKSTITGADKSPCPVLKVHTFRGDAKLFASVVTVPDDAERPKPHPHQLAGPSTGYGFYSRDVLITDNDDTIKLENLALVAIPNKEAKESLEQRENKRIDPYRTGFEHKERPSSIDRNYVQLCFQLAVRIPGYSPQQLEPVCSNPILNTNKKGDLEIVKFFPESGPTAGGKMIILVNGVNKKEDVGDIIFTDQKRNWKAKGRFKPKHIHEMAAIMLFYPEYNPKKFSEPAREVNLVLETRRGQTPPVKFFYLSENATSERKRERKLAFRKATQRMETENSSAHIPAVVEDQDPGQSASWSSSSMNSSLSNPSQPVEDQPVSPMSSVDQKSAIDCPAVVVDQNSLPKSQDQPMGEDPNYFHTGQNAQIVTSQSVDSNQENARYTAVKSASSEKTTMVKHSISDTRPERVFRHVDTIPSASCGMKPWGVAPTTKSNNPAMSASAFRARPIAKPRCSLPAQQADLPTWSVSTQGSENVETSFAGSFPLLTSLAIPADTQPLALHSPTGDEADIVGNFNLDETLKSLFSNAPAALAAGVSSQLNNLADRQEQVFYQRENVPVTEGMERQQFHTPSIEGLQNVETFVSAPQAASNFPPPSFSGSFPALEQSFQNYQTLPEISVLSQNSAAMSRTENLLPLEMPLATPNPAPRVHQRRAQSAILNRQQSAPTQTNMQSPVTSHGHARLSQDGQNMVLDYRTRMSFPSTASSGDASSASSQSPGVAIGPQSPNEALDDIAQVIAEDESFKFMTTSPS